MYWNFVAIDGVIKNQLDSSRIFEGSPVHTWVRISAVVTDVIREYSPST
jgi:hypothetical protein